LPYLVGCTTCLGDFPVAHEIGSSLFIELAGTAVKDASFSAAVSEGLKGTSESSEYLRQR